MTKETKCTDTMPGNTTCWNTVQNRSSCRVPTLPHGSEHAANRSNCKLPTLPQLQVAAPQPSKQAQQDRAEPLCCVQCRCGVSNNGSRLVGRLAAVHCECVLPQCTCHFQVQILAVDCTTSQPAKSLIILNSRSTTENIAKHGPSDIVSAFNDRHYLTPPRMSLDASAVMR